MKNHDTGEALAWLFLLGLMVAAYLAYENWSTVMHTGPVVRDKHGALWLETRDVAAGETLRGRVRVGGHLRVAIRGVIVNGAGPEHITEGREESWGDSITYRWSESDEGWDAMAFEVQAPHDAAGKTLHLDVRVEYVYAEGHVLEFSNEWSAATFRVDVPVYSATTSDARRAGKAALAIATWIAVVAFVVLLNRWHARRRRNISGYWALWLIPHAIFGWACFVVLLADAFRLHTAWLTIVGVAGWYTALPLAFYLCAGDSRRRYDLVQTRVPQPMNDAYRGGADVPSASVEDLVSAWQTAGLAVQLEKRALTITRLDGRKAVVALPPTDTFGAGEPIQVRTDDATLVEEIASAAAGLLGELRWHPVDDGKAGWAS